MSDHSIVVRGLSYSYPGGVTAVKAMSFSVPAGEVFGFLGPNGAARPPPNGS